MILTIGILNTDPADQIGFDRDRLDIKASRLLDP